MAGSLELLGVVVKRRIGFEIIISKTLVKTATEN